MFDNEDIISGSALEVASNETGWLGGKVSERNLDYSLVRNFLPEFNRRPLSFPQIEGTSSSIHPRLDSIMREPTEEDPYFRPVGVVSRNYGLVTHRGLFDAAEEALLKAGVTGITKAHLLMSEFGERMHLSLFLPDSFAFNPGDDNKMALRMEIINSVDGSSRLRVLLGWFRFVCSNGLVVGVTHMDLRRRHVRSIEPKEIIWRLPERLKDAKEEVATLSGWQKNKVNIETLDGWVDGPLKKAWGFKAAARTWLICNRGFDGEPDDSYAKYCPSTMPMKETLRVPGAKERARSLFDVAQALAWIAKERNDIEERLEWRAAIPKLLDELIL